MEHRGGRRCCSTIVASNLKLPGYERKAVRSLTGT